MSSSPYNGPYLNPFDPVCTYDEWLQSGTPNSSLTCLTHGEAVGLTLTLVAAFTSLISVLVILLFIIRNAIFRAKGGVRLIQEPMDVFMLSLFAANLTQAFGHSFDVNWLSRQRVYKGTTCTVEGIIQQLGETSVALATMSISFQTFANVWWDADNSLTVAFIAVFFSWTFVVVFIAATVGKFHNADYEMPEFWCWIGNKYTGEQLGGEYIWFWICLFSSILVYVPLHFCHRGIIEVDQTKWFSFKILPAGDRPNLQQRGTKKRRQFAMIAYPLAYGALVLPLSVVRWIAIFDQKRGVHNPVGYQAHYAVSALFELSGAVDVFLFLYARPGLLLFGERKGTSEHGRAPTSGAIEEDKLSDIDRSEQEASTNLEDPYV